MVKENLPRDDSELLFACLPDEARQNKTRTRKWCLGQRLRQHTFCDGIIFLKEKLTAILQKKISPQKNFPSKISSKKSSP